MENTVIVSEPGSSHYLPGPGKPFDPRASADAQESMKAKVVAIRRKLVEQVSGAASPPSPRGASACGELVKVFKGGGGGRQGRRRGAWGRGKEEPRGGAREPLEQQGI